MPTKMAVNGYRTVTIKIDSTGALVCDPDPAKLDWIKGPDNLRWEWEELPDQVVSVVIEWKNAAPTRGLGQLPPSPGKKRGAIVTSGNTRQPGRYWYSVYCLDAKDQIVAMTDPEVDNEPPVQPNP